MAHDVGDASMSSSDRYIIGRIYAVEVEQYIKGSDKGILQVVQSQGHLKMDSSTTTVAQIESAVAEGEHVPFQIGARYLMFLVPTAYAFGSPNARGVIQHRIAFIEKGSPPAHGKLQIEDYGAEAMSLKRVLERKAGNLDSFARGMSYIPEGAS